jgi:thioredoxin-related protein
MRPFRVRACGVLAALLLLALAAPAGLASEPNGDGKAPARPEIYNPKVNPRDQIKEALVKAGHDHKRVLIMYGGNWCGWCHKLHDTLKKDRDLARTLLYEYELVLIDSGNDQVAEITREHGAKINGVPYLTILDENGKVVCNQETASLEEGDHHDVKKVQEFLKRNAAAPRDAEKALTDALAVASSEGKMVLLHFGAPWCGWCHRLRGFLADQEIARILGQDFVDLEIDIDRMTHGKAIEKQYRKLEPGGIPWFAFLDASGKVLATSDGPNGNIGYPAAPEEIEHFVRMLTKHTKRMSPSQIAQIAKRLRESRVPVAADRSSVSVSQ